IQPLAREAFGKVPCFEVQRLHSGPAALLAKQAGQMRVVKGGLRAKGRVADDATIKPRKPATQPHRPEHEVAQRQGPISSALHFARGQQDQSEHRLRNFVLWQNQLRNLADHRQSRAEAVIALSLMKRLEQFRLLDTHQFARFPLDVPYLDVRENLERGAVAVLQPPRACGYAAHAPRRAPQKAHQAIRLAQGKCLQDDGFRFPRRHEQSARRRCAGQTTVHRPKRAHAQKYCNYHTRTPRAILAWRISEKTMPPTAVEGNTSPSSRTAPSARGKIKTVDQGNYGEEFILLTSVPSAPTL